jgi:hypothetical protein
MFLFSGTSMWDLESTQPLIKCVPGVLPWEAKRPGREADQSLMLGLRIQ